MRRIVPINAEWKYRPEFSEDWTGTEFDDSSWESAVLPHANAELPYNGFDESDYQFVSCYRRSLEVPADAKGMRIALRFEGVMLSCRIWLNGVDVGEHRGGYTPFEIDVSHVARAGERNQICVMVDSREQDDIPPFGNVVDFLTYGGMYREAQLIISDRQWISSAVLIEWDAKGDAAYRVRLGGVRSPLENGSATRVRIRVLDHGAPLAEGDAGAGDGDIKVSLNLAGVIPWDIDDPRLYEIEVDLLRDGEAVDRLAFRSGFRRAEFRNRGFFLNGRKITLRGLNRHQSFPYAGYAMPARAQRRDADILKYELEVNIVRTSHYPQSRHFLDRCDEIGLLVMEEIPGWQHIGSGEWLERSVEDTRDMVLSDAHRPSIVLWGVRINESPDHTELFSRTNAAAREIDPLRQTGGVRNFAGSEVLEDVYTFNDFTHNGSAGPILSRRKVAKRRMPYLVTEHNGHMFPTKRFDQEERLVEHALRHARVIDAAARAGDVAGAIGWCAFDYNTHREFGSGDRICYHGVMDMFREPKYAAGLYASQMNPRQRPVMEPASIFAMGERNEAKNLPVQVFTNCDFVRVYRNGELIGDYSRRKGELPGLDYPPVVIDEMVGSRLDGRGFSSREISRLKRLLAQILDRGTGSLSPFQWLSLGWIFLRHGIDMAEGERIMQQATTGWGDGEQTYRLEGWIGDECRIVKEYGSSVPARLRVAADDGEISARTPDGTWDCTRVVFRLEDQFGNLMPFVNEYLDIELTGPAELIGPSRTALIGGTIACWIRSSGEPGTATISGRCGRFQSDPVQVQLN
jgi:beta-galactosidase